MPNSSPTVRPRSLLRDPGSTAWFLLWFAVAVLLALRAVAPSSWQVDNWRFTHWMFNYEIEFVKRGLAGEILRHVAPVTREWVTAVSYGLLAAVSAALLLAFSRPWRERPEAQGAGLFFLFAVAHPATIQHFSFDLGRFDGFGLLLTMAALAAIRAQARMLPLLVPLLLAIAILFHEAALFMFVPMTYAYWYHADPDRRRLRIKALTALFTVTWAYATIHQGMMASLSFAEHMANLRAVYGNTVNPTSLIVLFRDVRDNVNATLPVAFTVRQIQRHAEMAVVLIPTVLFVWALLVRSRAEKMDWSAILFLASCLAPLTLYSLALDHFRWWAIAVSNLFLAFALLAGPGTEFGERLARVATERKGTLCLGLVIGLVVGPLGNRESFPCSLLQVNVSYLKKLAALWLS